MDDPILKALGAFASEPTPERYRILRDAATASPHYSPYSDNLGEVAIMLKQGGYEAADDLLRAGMANYLLTPTAHFMMAFVADKLGDERRRDMEAAIGRLLLQGILESGDGSREKPYLVTRIKDEHEVLSHLGKTMESQALVNEEDGRSMDQIQCADGTTYWFDISVMFAQLGRSLSAEPASPTSPPTDPPEPRPTAPWWKRLGRRP